MHEILDVRADTAVYLFRRRWPIMLNTDYLSISSDKDAIDLECHAGTRHHVDVNL